MYEETNVRVWETEWWHKTLDMNGAVERPSQASIEWRSHQTLSSPFDLLSCSSCSVDHKRFLVAPHHRFVGSLPQS